MAIYYSLYFYIFNIYNLWNDNAVMYIYCQSAQFKKKKKKKRNSTHKIHASSLVMHLRSFFESPYLLIPSFTGN
jgi:hypothetical protein